MLEERQLILVVAEVVQQPQHQARRDVAAGDRDRPGDRRAQRVARHARHQVLARR